MSELNIVPCSIVDACEFVTWHHRHHRAPQGGLFALALAYEDDVVAVAIVGRPVARMADDGWTAEVTRLCSLGMPNACSMLYRACWRAAAALGYRRLITYTLDTEPGDSLRGAGFKLIGTSPGGSWSRPSRPTVDKHPLQAKLRWELTA